MENIDLGTEFKYQRTNSRTGESVKVRLLPNQEVIFQAPFNKKNKNNGRRGIFLGERTRDGHDFAVVVFNDTGRQNLVEGFNLQTYQE